MRVAVPTPTRCALAAIWPATRQPEDSASAEANTKMPRARGPSTIVGLDSRSKTGVAAQLKLGEGVVERNSAKATKAKLRPLPCAAKTSSFTNGSPLQPRAE